jgi:cytosine/adenosine deaminase-related metal-dependent hydrolase
MAEEISRKSFFKLGAGLAALAAAGGASAAAPKKAEPAPLKPVKTLIKGADVMTCEKGKPDLLGYDVLIDGGKIVSVEKSIPVQGAEVVDAKGMCLLPGFTDGFRHNWETIQTGRILKTNNSYPHYYGGYTGNLAGAMTPEDFHFAEYIGGIEAINSGYTNVTNFAHGHHTQDRLEAAVMGYKESGAGGTFCWMVDGESNSTGRTRGAPRALPLADELYKRGEMLRDKYLSSTSADTDLLFGLATNASVGRPLPALVEHFKRLRALSPHLICEHYTRQAKMPAAPLVQNLEQMYEAGLFKPDYHLSHALTLTNDELVLMAKSGMTVASAPCIEMSYDRVETCIHARAHKYGVPASFGYDAPVEAVRDPFEMLRMGFAVLFKTQESWAISETLSSEDLMAWMTRVGAEATKKGDITGTVTAGKRADLVLVRMDNFGMPTNGTLADRVINFCALSDIDSVWVGGKRRKKDGRMIGIDTAKLRAERSARDARTWAAIGSPKFANPPG